MSGTEKNMNSSDNGSHCVEKDLYIGNLMEASLLLQKAGFMKTIFNKTIFNNKRKVTFYTLFSIAILSFVALLLCQDLLNVYVSSLVFLFVFIAMMFTGSIVLQLRSGPPW